MISYGARQRFRQRLQHIEDADEILNALNQFIERFTIISGQFSSNSWETIYEYTPQENETVMMTFSIIGRESLVKQAGLKRTSVFFKQLGVTSVVQLQQSDFTSKSDNEFNARLLPDGDRIKFQVKGASNNLTQWKGSVEIEKLGV